MDELYLQWQDNVTLGITNQSFESWLESNKEVSMSPTNLVVLTRTDICDMFDQDFDAMHECVVFGSLSYIPSNVLKAVDAVSYYEAVLDWQDEAIDNGTLVEVDGYLYGHTIEGEDHD